MAGKKRGSPTLPPRHAVRVSVVQTFAEYFSNITDQRFAVLYGSASSGKSFAIAQQIVMDFLSESEPFDILVTRKTGPSLNLTARKLIIELLKRYKCWNRVSYNKVEGIITSKASGSRIIFKSMDDPTKIMSLNLHRAWLEEAGEFSWEEFDMINLRVREHHHVLPPRIFFSFNPTENEHWLIQKFVNGSSPDALVHHSTYLDNPYNTDETIKMIESYKDTNPTFWRRYGLGLPGVLEGAVYTNWEAVDVLPQWFVPTAIGLDFGYNDATAVVGTMVKDGVAYVHEYIYRRELTITELSKLMEIKKVPRGVPMYADPSRPDSIKELQALGWLAQTSMSHKILDGIAYVQTLKLKVSKESVSTINELQKYAFHKNRTTGKVEGDNPVDMWNHAADAMRYSLYNSRGSEVKYDPHPCSYNDQPFPSMGDSSQVMNTVNLPEMM